MITAICHSERYVVYFLFHASCKACVYRSVRHATLYGEGTHIYIYIKLYRLFHFMYVHTYLVKWDSTSTFALPSPLLTSYPLCPNTIFQFPPLPAFSCLQSPLHSPPLLPSLQPTLSPHSSSISNMVYNYGIENDYTSTNTHYKFITPPHASINQEHRSLRATSHRLQVFKCTVRRLTRSVYVCNYAICIA